MALDFFEMMKQEQEKNNVKKECEEKTLFTEAVKSNSNPKEQKDKQIVKENKKASKSKIPIKKVMTFDEQMENTKNKNIIKIIEHLLELEGMREKMEESSVSIEKMYEYIQSQAKKQAKNGCAMISDEEVYGWGRHYYDEHGKVAE